MLLHSALDNGPAENSAPPVILLHGLFGRGRNLGTLQRAFSGQFRSIALDLRSHGDSPHGALTYPAMAQDVLDTLDSLKIERATLIGHSMGGKVAMAAALLAADRVSALVIADIAPATIHQGHSAMAASLNRLAFPPFLDRASGRQLLLPACRTREVADLLLQNVRLGENPGWSIGMTDIAAGIDAVEAWPDSLAHGPAWPGPALFLRGENSPYIQPRDHAQIEALFPQARIETIADAGHWLHVEQPKSVIARITAFLEEQTNGPGATAPEAERC